MRLTVSIVLLMLFIGCTQGKLQKVTDDELVRIIVEDDWPDLNNLEILNSWGSAISLDSLQILEATGRYFEDLYVNENRELVRIVIREKTGDDEKLLARINKKFIGKPMLDEGPDLNPVVIDCTNKKLILQEIYDRDQGMRNDKDDMDPLIDHVNLELVVGLLEKCGMPTLKDVDHVHMAAIWLTLQHSPPKYQKKYIPLLEASAQNGDINWRVIALMKDRALMCEGEPQVFGSQVSNGELYDLFEPEYVNQRRAEIGMEPLEDYLERFGVDFNVGQKTKPSQISMQR